MAGKMYLLGFVPDFMRDSQNLLIIIRKCYKIHPNKIIFRRSI